MRRQYTANNCPFCPVFDGTGKNNPLYRAFIVAKNWHRVCSIYSEQK